MKKGDEYEARVERMDFPDRGVCTAEEREVFVKYALPGQLIRFRITKKKAGRVEGRLLEVLESSPLEEGSPVEAHDPDQTESDGSCGICPNFGSCGSCLFQTLPYEEELKIKEAQVRRLLRNANGGDLSFFEGIIPSPARYAYRNKMEYTFGDPYRDGPLVLGMHRRGSFYDIADAGCCRIADPDFGSILKCVRDLCRDAGWPHYRKDHTGFLRNLLVRKARATGEIMVDLVTSRQVPAGWDAQTLTDALSQISLSGRIVSILHTWNDREADVIEDQGTEVLFGRPWIEEKVLGLTFRITAFSFFQTNTAGAQVLYSLVRTYINGSMPGSAAPGASCGVSEAAAYAEREGNARPRLVFDLYSGTGTIAQLISPAADKVVGIEIVPEAVEAAKMNAVTNGISNCVFYCGDVLKTLDEIEERADLIILDPPRDGVHPKALPKIIAYGAERIVYISCKPSSLARDLPVLEAAGYRPVRAACVDMFPGTGNVETVCLLSNRKPDEKIRIDVDLEDYFRIKDKKQRTE